VHLQGFWPKSAKNLADRKIWIGLPMQKDALHIAQGPIIQGIILESMDIADNSLFEPEISVIQ